MDGETIALVIFGVVILLVFSGQGSGYAQPGMYGGYVGGGLYGAPQSAYGGGAPQSAYGGGGGTVQDTGDVDVLARTIYGEARGEGQAGMQAVADVVMNRFNDGSFGFSISAVCQAPSQFSCWNANDPNRNVIMAVTSSDPTFQQCLSIASQAASGGLPDATGGALYYHDTSIATPQSWLNAGYVETVQIGRLVFFRPGGIA